jgi:hypothetical protein
MPESGTNRRWARRGRTYPRVGVIQHKRRRRILQVKCWAEVWASRIYCLPTVCRMQSVVCIVMYCVVLCCVCAGLFKGTSALRVPPTGRTALQNALHAWNPQSANQNPDMRLSS